MTMIVTNELLALRHALDSAVSAITLSDFESSSRHEGIIPGTVTCFGFIEGIKRQQQLPRVDPAISSRFDPYVPIYQVSDDMLLQDTKN